MAILKTITAYISFPYPTQHWYDFNLTIGDTIIADAAFGMDTFYVVSDDSTGYQGRRKITLEAISMVIAEWVEGMAICGFGTLWDNFSAGSISGGHIFWCLYADSVTIPDGFESIIRYA